MAELANAIGEEPARILARCFGGISLYVPRTIGDNHPVCAAIGRTAADKLAAWTGGASLSVPKQAERRTRVRELRSESNLTVGQIALQTSFSERHVYRLLSGQDDERQPSLFDDQA